MYGNHFWLHYRKSYNCYFSWQIESTCHSLKVGWKWNRYPRQKPKSELNRK